MNLFQDLPPAEVYFDVGVAGVQDLEIKPPAGELWVIHDIAAAHDGAAGRDIDWVATTEFGVSDHPLAHTTAVASGTNNYLYTVSDVVKPMLISNVSWIAVLTSLQAGESVAILALVSKFKGLPS